MSATQSVSNTTDQHARPTVRTRWRTVALTSALGLTLWSAACSQKAGNGPESGLTRRDVQGLDRAERYLTSASGENRPADLGTGQSPQRPAAMIDGEPMTWDALRAPLAEAAGAEVLRETALESRLRKRMEREGLALTEAMIERERELFAAAAASAGVSSEDAAAALERVRRERGLGPVRFAALLRRSAMLRALVGPRVNVNDASIAQAYALRHGERFRARVIVTPTAREAAAALARVRGGEDFSRIAAEVSTDASAARGGVIEPISPADPAYPKALRDTLAAMKPGEVSDPVVLEGGFALLVLDERLAASAPPLDVVRAEMEREARSRQERLLMEQLAREIDAGADIRPLDAGLRWSVDVSR